MSEILRGALPKGISFEWGESEGQRTVEAVNCWGATREVHHQLPERVETATILRATGVGITAVANALHTDISAINNLTDTACNTLNLLKIPGPKHLRMPAILARFCLPEGIIGNIDQPIAVTNEADEKSLRMLTLLGEGKSWDEVARDVGYRQKRAAMDYLAKHFYPEAVGETINTAAFLLYAYSARLISPEDIVANQYGTCPELPMSLPPPKGFKIQLSRRGVYKRPSIRGQEDDTPESFQPFSDKDKTIELTQKASGEYAIHAVKACGAELAFNDTNIIKNFQEQTVNLNSREKLALVLLTLGSNLDDIENYCLNKKQFASLFTKLDISRDTFGYNKAALLTCRELLNPITPPEWQIRAPDFSWMRTYEGQFHIMQKVSEYSQAYACEDLKSWRGVNIMILLGYAANCLPDTNHLPEK